MIIRDEGSKEIVGVVIRNFGKEKELVDWANKPPMVNPVARYPLPGGLEARVIHQSGQPDYSTGSRIRGNISYSIL